MSKSSDSTTYENLEDRSLQQYSPMNTHKELIDITNIGKKGIERAMSNPIKEASKHNTKYLKTILSEGNITKTGGTPSNLRVALLKMSSNSMTSNETDVDDHEDESTGRHTPLCFAEASFNVSRDINTPTRKLGSESLSPEFPINCEEDNQEVSTSSQEDESRTVLEKKLLTVVDEHESELIMSISADESHYVEEQSIKTMSNKLCSKVITSDTLIEISSSEDIQEVMGVSEEEQKFSRDSQELSQSQIGYQSPEEHKQMEPEFKECEFRDFEMEIDYKSKEIHLISNNRKIKMLCWENFSDFDQMQAALGEMLFNIQANS